MYMVQTTIEVLEVFGTIIKNPQTLRFVPDHLKCKNMCKHAVKKLSF